MAVLVMAIFCRGNFVRNIFLILILVLLSQVAMAEFIEFTKLDVATIYVDKSSLVKKGNVSKLWVMIDYNSPQSDKVGKMVLSDKLQYQYDCKGKQFQIIASSAHAGQKATGETVSVNPDPPVLTPVVAGTLDESFWKIACTKK
jgi:hypothetical protein